MVKTYTQLREIIKQELTKNKSSISDVEQKIIAELGKILYVYQLPLDKLGKLKINKKLLKEIINLLNQSIQALQDMERSNKLFSIYSGPLYQKKFQILLIEETASSLAYAYPITRFVIYEDGEHGIKGYQLIPDKKIQEYIMVDELQPKEILELDPKEHKELIFRKDDVRVPQLADFIKFYLPDNLFSGIDYSSITEYLKKQDNLKHKANIKTGGNPNHKNRIDKIWNAMREEVDNNVFYEDIEPYRILDEFDWVCSYLEHYVYFIIDPYIYGLRNYKESYDVLFEVCSRVMLYNVMTKGGILDLLNNDKDFFELISDRSDEEYFYKLTQVILIHKLLGGIGNINLPKTYNEMISEYIKIPNFDNLINNLRGKIKDIYDAANLKGDKELPRFPGDIVEFHDVLMNGNPIKPIVTYNQYNFLKLFGYSEFDIVPDPDFLNDNIAIMKALKNPSKELKASMEYSDKFVLLEKYRDKKIPNFNKLIKYDELTEEEKLSITDEEINIYEDFNRDLGKYYRDLDILNEKLDREAERMAADIYPFQEQYKFNIHNRLEKYKKLGNLFQDKVQELYELIGLSPSDDDKKDVVGSNNYELVKNHNGEIIGSNTNLNDIQSINSSNFGSSPHSIFDILGGLSGYKITFNVLVVILIIKILILLYVIYEITYENKDDTILLFNK